MYLHEEPNAASLKAQAEKVVQHINSFEELTQEQLDECVSGLYAAPQRWATVVMAVAQDIENLPRFNLQEEPPRLSLAILASLLRGSSNRSDFLSSLPEEWLLLKLVRHAIPKIKLTEEEFIGMMCWVDTQKNLMSARTSFIAGYSDWALLHPESAIKIIDEWLSLKPWSAYAHHTSIAMLTSGAVRNPLGGAPLRARLLEKIFDQRRLHQWLLALHIQAYAYEDPMPDNADRCSAIVSAVERDPLNLAVEALGLIERHLLLDSESALIAYDVISDAISRETVSLPPPPITLALSSILARLQHRLEAKQIVERLDFLVAFPLMDSRKRTLTHNHTLDSLLNALWKDDPHSTARFFRQYLVYNSETIQAEALTLDVLFCGLTHAMGPEPLGQFLVGLLTDQDPNSRKVGVYLLEASMVQRLPPVEIKDGYLQALSGLHAKVVILELAGRAASEFYIGLSLRLLSLHPTLMEEDVESWISHFVSDYPGACRRAMDTSVRLHPNLAKSLETALREPTDHQRKLNDIAEIFSLAQFGARWHTRENEIMKAHHNDERDSGRYLFLSIGRTVHLARGARRWGVAGETKLMGTKEIVTEFEGSRLYCASPLLYDLLRQGFLLRAHSLLYSERGE